jgi:two-component system sensor histidine kinase BaeS
MRRRFLRKFLVFLVLVVVAIMGLSALIGGFLSRGDQHGGPFFPVGLVVIVLVLLLVARAGRRFASPVADVMEAADRVAAGDYETRVEERGPREVRRLGRAFNAMTERLGSNETRRRQLLADVAHELRTPLSVIQANLEALIDGLYPTDEEHLRSVLQETKTMSRLLNDLQTLSTAEAGALTLHREPTAPGDLIDAAVRSFAAQASEAGVRLETQIADGLGEIDVDRLRIGEVLGNLLSNALRYTPAGGTVTLSARSVDAKDGGLELAVSDTGPGVPPERLAYVFDRFSRAVDSPGAGLGLAIAKSLVEAHGGSIRAESGADGTTITVVLSG